MASDSQGFIPVCASLADLLGEQYCQTVAGAASVLTGAPAESALSEVHRKIDFLPKEFIERQAALLSRVGAAVASSLKVSADGATTAPFAASTKVLRAPLSASGLFRIGEDGRLYLIAKGEHYHVSVGHAFPGWELLSIARQLGIPNATHNNTRGHITRLLEEALVAATGGTSLSRVLNLETGSLALEAAIKLVLARFYRPQTDSRTPRYEGKRPVLLVIADADGDVTANYHGTTIVAQTMRGMWSDIRRAIHDVYEVRGVRPNDSADLAAAFGECSAGARRVAGAFIELILMNYGALTLTVPYVRQLADLCRCHDAPLIVDEIQTGLWSPQLFMFREYGIVPSAIGLGKGFPGGEYAASRLIFAPELDVLPQFGALVTNGQEEIASLAYLVNMRWAQANCHVTAQIGDYFETRMREWADKHRDVISAIQGKRHLLGIQFHELVVARAFAKAAESMGIDISVQTYKTSIPPAALTKLPLIANHSVVDFLVDRFERSLAAVSGQMRRVAT